MVRYFIGTLLLFAIGSVWAQPADTLVLPEFETTELRFRQLQDYLPAVTGDSAAMEFYREGSVVNLLQYTFPVIVRSNGPSASVTISNRGLAAAHTAVFWNGININAPTTGLADFSLIPAAFVDHIALSLGGSSAVMGSGLIGGGIHLNYRQPDNETLNISISQSMSTIGNAETAVRAAVAGENWRSKTNIVWHRGLNKYRFYNNAKKDAPEEIRSGNDFTQYGFTQRLSRNIGVHNLSIDLWALETERQIPPGLTAANQQEEQSDRNLKAVIQADLDFRRIKSRLQLGVLHDELQYRNKHENNSDIGSSTILLNADFTAVLSRYLQLNFGTNNQIQQAAVANFYTQTEQILTNSVYAGSHFTSRNNNLELNLMLRYDAYSEYSNAFSPSFAVSYQTFKWLKWKLSATRNYRIPGFNDRFWFPGGNPDLIPEDAYQLGFGPEFKVIARKYISLGVAVNGFYNLIDNWIQWIPQGIYWGAVSYKSVRTTGANINSHFRYQKNHWNLNASGAYNFTYAQNLESEFDDALNGKILPHIPLQKFSASAGFGWKGLHLFLNTSYTGNRFISTDNKREMEAFMLTNAGIGYHHSFGVLHGDVHFKVHNLTNTDYQIMPWMPMPLRYYSITLKFSFIKPHIKK